MSSETSMTNVPIDAAHVSIDSQGLTTSTESSGSESTTTLQLQNGLIQSSAIRTPTKTPSQLFINNSLGVLELMWSTDRSISISMENGNGYFSASRKLIKQIKLGNTEYTSNLAVYQRFQDETEDHRSIIVFFLLLSEDDSVTPSHEISFVPAGQNIAPETNNTSDDAQASTAESSEAASERLNKNMLSEQYYNEKIKQPCEAVMLLFENSYAEYFKERWRGVHRLDAQGSRNSFMIHTASNFSLGLSKETLENFRPFNNIQIKALQSASFDAGSHDVSRSIKLFLPHLPWNIVEDISDTIDNARSIGNNTRALKKALKAKTQEGHLAIENHFVYFNRIEVDLIQLAVIFKYEEGEWRISVSLQHVKFSILDDTKTVPLLGPLPAPLGFANDTLEPLYSIEVCQDLKDLNKNKANGALGISFSVNIEPWQQTLPTSQSLCIINKLKSNQSSYIAHGSVWCCGVKIDLIINRYKEVDIKLSYVSVDEFQERYIDSGRYNVAVVSEVDISHDRLVEIAVGVFEESFFKYKITSKNCLAYMETLAKRLTSYRSNRLLRCNIVARPDAKVTEKERDELQNAINHYADIQSRISAFRKKSRWEAFIHWISRRGVDGNVLIVNAQ
ncbi:hypothetical protein EC991_009331 [Linnemannia zychae]|nr:hypothetical protein EC991_009331 [Linnemannia zychae]